MCSTPLRDERMFVVYKGLSPAVDLNQYGPNPRMRCPEWGRAFDIGRRLPTVSQDVWRTRNRPTGDRNPLAQHRCGRPAVTVEIRQLIRQMSVANSLWGAPRT